MIQVVVDDLAFIEADAIVRPATASLEPTTPSLRRLEHVGGPTFWQRLSVQDPLPVGAAVVTGAGELAADLVIHAIITSVTEPVTVAGVYQALISVWQRAADWQLARVAIPPIGTGAGNLSMEDAADVIRGTLPDVEHGPFPRQVTIVVQNEQEKAVFDARLQHLPG